MANKNKKNKSIIQKINEEKVKEKKIASKPLKKYKNKKVKTIEAKKNSIQSEKESDNELSDESTNVLNDLKRKIDEKLLSEQDCKKPKLPVPVLEKLKTSENTSKSKESFRRVKDEELDESYLKKFGKNAFDNKKGAQGSWGEKANKDLIQTRGKSFRHEKNKKKRGSYCGGKIDTSTYSVKFDSD